MARSAALRRNPDLVRESIYTHKGVGTRQSLFHEHFGDDPAPDVADRPPDFEDGAATEPPEFAAEDVPYPVAAPQTPSPRPPLRRVVSRKRSGSGARRTRFFSRFRQETGQA